MLIILLVIFYGIYQWEIVLCQQYVGGGGLEQANTISYTLISIIPKFPKGKKDILIYFQSKRCAERQQNESVAQSNLFLQPLNILQNKF